ncbi:MAG: IS630 family transposase, partial [Candidatus Aminicenantes bacterium]|nr:IS630 family transposase [Candidatus Aminicenantes bacterium]
ADLIKAIKEYIRLHNQEPKPFVWVKKVDQILAKIGHCKSVIETLH